MYKLIQKNQKKLLAIFAAFLMVVFIVPNSAKYGNSSARHGRQVGHIGKEKIYADDLERGKAEWELLSRNIRGEDLAPRMGYATYIQIHEHPELFYFLHREAENSAITISNDVLNTTLANEIPLTQFVSAEHQDLATNAVRHLLEVIALHDRLASAVKVSQPMVEHEYSDHWETVRLNLVEYSALEFKNAVAAPTTQQVREQFDKYKTITPDAPMKPADDPLGFGYEVPDRVKVQYIALPRKALLEAARSTKDPYAWEVAARTYYYEHPDEFTRLAPAATQPTTAPATEPSATQPTTAPTTQASATEASTTQATTTQPATAPAVATTAPSTQPTLRPFAEVHGEILDKLLAPEADRLATEITAAIGDKLKAGFLQFQAVIGPITQPSASAASQPTTQPAPYDAYAYLENVAAEIQARYKLLPEVHQSGEWADAKQLALEPGIGQAHTADFRSFAQYAIDAAPLSNSTALPGKLQLFQPSDPLTDDAKNTYMFRLTAADPAHAPDAAAVTARVEEDARTAAAYMAANENARKLLDAAKAQGLAAAALAAHKPISSTGNFRLSQQAFLPNFIASPAATAALVGKARALLEEATPSNPHPVALVEMPSDRKVMVVGLADVAMDSSDDRTLFLEKFVAMEREKITKVEALAQTWFKYDTVLSRLGYVSDDTAKPAGS